MSFVGLTHFSNHVSRYVRHVRKSEDVYVVTRNGEPAFAIFGVTEDSDTGVYRGRGRFKNRAFKRAALREVSVRELSRSTHERVSRFPENSEPMLVTYHGHPAALLQKPDETTFLALAISNDPGFREDMQRAEADILAGRTTPYAEVVEELKARKATASSTEP